MHEHFGVPHPFRKRLDLLQVLEVKLEEQDGAPQICPTHSDARDLCTYHSRARENQRRVINED